MERQYQGTLNSKNHFGDQETRRFDKYVRINRTLAYNPLRMKWFNQKFEKYSSNKNLSIYHTEKKVVYGQRSWNLTRANKSRYIVLMPWRV